MPTLLMIVATVLWGASYVSIKLALQDIPPLAFVFYRFFFAFLIMTPGLVFQKTTVSYQDLVRGTKLGLLMAGIMLTQTLGLATISASLSAFLSGFSIVFILIIKLVSRQRSPRLGDWFTSLVCLAGLWLVTQGHGMVWGPGVWYTMLCAFLIALYTIAVASYVVDGDTLVLTLIQMLVVALLVTPLTLLAHGSIQVPTYVLTWKAILFCASFCSCVAFGLQAYCQRYLKALKVAMILMLEPVFTTVFSYVILGEVPYPSFYAGACMILGAITFMNVRMEHI